MRLSLYLFIIIPMAELFLLLKVAEWIGAWATLVLIVFTAFVGITVLKRQGLSTLRQANNRLQSGQLPAQEIVEGMMLAFAGALLLTPGLITDTIGFTLLIQPVRQRLAARILRKGTGFFFSAVGGSQQPGGRAGGATVEGEYVKDANPPLPGKDSD